MTEQVEAASKCVSGFGSAELERVEATTWKFFSSLISDYMVRLHCAFGRTSDEQVKREISDSLQRLFSGLGLSKQQIQSCVKLLPEMMADPEGFAKVVRALLDESQRNGMAIEDYLAISNRLKDKEVRKEFIERLKSLGMSETRTAKALSSNDASQSLPEILAHAERSVITLGMSFLREVDARGTQALRTARWMRLHIVDAGSYEAERDAKSNFTQALKELLTGFTNEGIEPERLSVAKTDDEIRSACDDVDCGAVIRVRFETVSGALVAKGRLLFNPTKTKTSGSTANSSQQADISSPPLDTSCGAGAGRALDEAAKRQCLSNHIHAAHAFMNKLSEQVALFGGLAFMKAPRQVETVKPTLHQGVTITDLMSPDPEQAPDILGRGIDITNSSTNACAGELFKAFEQRLRNSYLAYIGRFKTRNAPTLLAERDERNCRVSLLVDGKAVYKVVGIGDKPSDVGEDLGRAIGDYYVDIASLKGLPTRSLPVQPSPWEAMYLAGAPFLRETTRSERNWGILYSSVDWAGLACGVVATGLAIKWRNDYTNNDRDALQKANWAASGAFICLGASLLSRGAGALHYWAAH